jgi:DNA ligase-1
MSHGMKFSTIAAVFDQIENENSRTAITIHLASLLKQSTPEEAKMLAYLSLGSLNPPYIPQQFNVAEKSLLSAVAVLLGQSLIEVKAAYKKAGDLGLLVIGGCWAGSSDLLSLIDVECMLKQLQHVSGSGSQEIREEKIIKLLRSLDPVSAKYVLRIIAGSLRLGFSDMTLLDAFSWMMTGDKTLRKQLEEAYNNSADIGLIIATLKTKGVEGIGQIAIAPGIPIRPSAAERLSDAAAIIKKLGPCIAQPKLDGFRLQVHIDNRPGHETIRFFSRNLLDMSDMFPDLVAELKKINVLQLVAEGEAICIDPKTGLFLPFQETVKRKRKHDIAAVAQEFPLKLFLFDMLYLNGQSLLSQTHMQRREAMLAVCSQSAISAGAVVMAIDEEMVSDADQLYHYFEQNISLGLEGLVVKRPDAIYQPGKRNFNWIKLKREETGSLDDTLDCVILGYYAGQGRRAHFGIGAILVGVYNPAEDVFQTVAKVGTGFTDAEWHAIKHQCDNAAVPNIPNNVQCAKSLYPDVWVAPTIVCMVRADEITVSPSHTAGKNDDQLGYALRFPRFMGYRPDKMPTAATGPEELIALYRLQNEKKSGA